MSSYTRLPTPTLGKQPCPYHSPNLPHMGQENEHLVYFSKEISWLKRPLFEDLSVSLSKMFMDNIYGAYIAFILFHSVPVKMFLSLAPCHENVGTGQVQSEGNDAGWNNGTSHSPGGKHHGAL